VGRISDERKPIPGGYSVGVFIGGRECIRTAVI
jgi:hypothetical protein